jgi:hypothetical protein
MELKQRRLFSRQSFAFDNTTLRVSTWSLVTGTTEWSVRLDEIAYRYDVRQMGLFSNGCLFSVAIIILSTMVIISLPVITALVVLVIAMTPLLLGRVINRYNYLGIPSRRGPILIGYSKKEKQQADEFVTGLLQAAKKYMVWKYGTVDADLNTERQFENFWWLRKNEMITEDEYGQLKAKLKESLRKPDSTSPSS